MALGIRDRRPSALSTTTLKPATRDDDRELLRVAWRATSANAAKIAAYVKGMTLPRLDAMIEEDRHGKGELFIDTALGGVSIAVGVLVALVLLLWVCSFI